MEAFETHPNVDNFWFPSKYNVNLIWYTFKPFIVLTANGRGHVPLFDLPPPLHFSDAFFMPEIISRIKEKLLPRFFTRN